MRKLIGAVVVFVVAVIATPVEADQGPAGTEGCVVSGRVSSPRVAGVRVHWGSCSYRARRLAGLVGSGSSWSVTVVREGVTYTYGPGTKSCVDVIAAGDYVTVTASGSSTAAAGNPAGSAIDPVPENRVCAG